MRWEGMVRPVGEDILMVVVGEGKVRLVDIFNKLKGWFLGMDIMVVVVVEGE